MVESSFKNLKISLQDYLSEELQEFQAILLFQQDMQKNQLESSKITSCNDQFNRSGSIGDATKLAFQYYRGLYDLLEEGNVNKVNMNVQYILYSIKNSKNKYLEDYTMLFEQMEARLKDISKLNESQIKQLKRHLTDQSNIPPNYMIETDLNNEILKTASLFVALTSSVLAIIVVGTTLIIDSVLIGSIVGMSSLFIVGYILLFKYPLLIKYVISHFLLNTLNADQEKRIMKLLDLAQPKYKVKQVFESAPPKLENHKGQAIAIQNISTQPQQIANNSTQTNTRIVDRKETLQANSRSNVSKTRSKSSSSDSSTTYSSSASYISSDSSSSSCDGGGSSGCD